MWNKWMGLLVWIRIWVLTKMWMRVVGEWLCRSKNIVDVIRVWVGFSCQCGYMTVIS